jgi:hypothetical protein
MPPFGPAYNRSTMSGSVDTTLRLPFTCDQALKEWAVAIQALGAGQQALIIRKGGIREDSNRFEVKFQRFLLFPSFEHQQEGLLRPEYAAGLAGAIRDDTDPTRLTFTHFATVHRAFSITEPEELVAMAPHHIWTDEYAEKRLWWRPKQALTAMVLRVYRLGEPRHVPVRPEYAGCKSWLQMLDGVTVDSVTPALSDDDFNAEATAIDAAMGSARTASPA